MDVPIKPQSNPKNNGEVQTKKSKKQNHRVAF